MNKPIPIFLFSLPRSGSTLLQRVLATSDTISSVAEPWLLLPMLFPLTSRSAYAPYSNSVARTALEEFVQKLPGGKSDYRAAIRLAALEMYGGLTDPGSRYFLDKTPRYHLICEQVIKTFPEAKFIFLWRNPLSIIASMIETWGAGKWNIYKYKIDLYAGIENLLNAFSRNKESCLALNYESLVTKPNEQLELIGNFLGTTLGEELLQNFKGTRFVGNLGDVTSSVTYDSISEDSTTKWTQTICNTYRKSWCKRYLKWLGADHIAMMNYDLDELLSGLDAVDVKPTRLYSDLVRSGYGFAYNALEPRMMFEKWQNFPDWKKFVTHS